MSILRNLVAFNVPKYDLVIIYTLYIRSIIEQSCVVWGPSLTESDAAALERVQKCSLRIIYDTEYISYNHALSKSGLSDLSSRRVKLLQKFADKCIQNEATNFMFPLNESMVNTRHHERYKVQMAHHTRLQNSSIIAMSQYLNTQ